MASKGEAAFALHCRAEKLAVVPEYRFHPTRKWRFDFYFPEQMLAVEVEGGVNGRHQRIGGFSGDCEKYNEAAKMGIRVMRYTTAQVMQGAAISDVLEVLGSSGEATA